MPDFNPTKTRTGVAKIDAAAKRRRTPDFYDGQGATAGSCPYIDADRAAVDSQAIAYDNAEPPQFLVSFKV